jgi:hypothetical protein
MPLTECDTALFPWHFSGIWKGRKFRAVWLTVRLTGTSKAPQWGGWGRMDHTLTVPQIVDWLTLYMLFLFLKHI